MGLPSRRRAWVVVGLGEVAVDGRLEVDDGAEDAALEPSLGQGGEEAFDGIQPGAGGRREVEGPAWMPGEPGPDLRMLVGGVVVERSRGSASRPAPRLDRVEEADEFLMPVACMQRPMTVPSSTFERGEQRGRAVPLVVMRHRAGAALLHRQSRLGAVERLDLALLVDRQHDGMRRRIDIEADDVLNFRRTLDPSTA